MYMLSHRSEDYVVYFHDHDWDLLSGGATVGRLGGMRKLVRNERKFDCVKVCPHIIDSVDRSKTSTETVHCLYNIDSPR
jgi:hypothetical protein